MFVPSVLNIVFTVIARHSVNAGVWINVCLFPECWIFGCFDCWTCGKDHLYPWFWFIFFYLVFKVMVVIYCNVFVFFVRHLLICIVLVFRRNSCGSCTIEVLFDEASKEVCRLVNLIFGHYSWEPIILCLLKKLICLTVAFSKTPNKYIYNLRLI